MAKKYSTDNTKESKMEANEESAKYNIEGRLIDLAVKIIKLTEVLPTTLAGKHLGGQLLRSGTSPALNYGEVQGAESRVDFIHKMKICLKELRETQICIKIIIQAGIAGKDVNIFKSELSECSEMVAIFAKSIETAKNNRTKK